jgi:hypothetical protein
VTGRRGRRSKQLLDYPKEVREEVIDRMLWRTRFGREEYELVVGQTTEDYCVVLYVLKVHKLFL